MNLETKTILSFPRDIKIQTMRDALEQDNFDMFLQLSKIFLNAPISEGGIETEIIQQIHDDYLAMRKDEHMADQASNIDNS